MRTRKIHALVQLGDLVDHESISRFVRESPKKQLGDLAEEWDLARGVMTKLVRAARLKNPDCLYYQLEGNHETRIKHLEDRYPFLRGLLTMETRLGVKANDGTWVASDSEAEILRFEWTKRGKIVPTIYQIDETIEVFRHGVSFIHGWRYSTHNAKAHADLSPWVGPIIYGHVHTDQRFTGDQWGLDKPVGISVGWLGKGIPEYAKRAKANRWAAGFGIVTLDPGTIGSWDVQVPKIRNGSLILDGRVFRVA
jgi:hypothetical protein